MVLARLSALAARGATAAAAIERLESSHWEGRLVAAKGPGAAIQGRCRALSLGDRATLHGRQGASTIAEIIAVRGGVVHSMPFTAIDGIGVGSVATAPMQAQSSGLAVSDEWLSRVIDPLGQHLDDGDPPIQGSVRRSVRSPAPDATRRARLGERMSLGVRALDLFATCRHGQRIGLFAGSGVGKSSLLAMLARNALCDLSVIALIGERGREVREFLEDDLGSAGLARSVIVVATSDASPLMRREAAYAAMTVAEHFRDRGQKVLLLMDSVTRFCQALREIALSAGEPPASRGFPPSVFAELPRLLERAGPGHQGTAPSGSITAFFTVLVDGDDHNEPIADSVRGLLDGHVVLDRQIAERGRFPAIDVRRSLSRSVPGCNSEAENDLASKARRLLAIQSDVAEIVRLGAYRAGADPEVDRALALTPRIESVLRQRRDEPSELADSFDQLRLAME